MLQFVNCRIHFTHNNGIVILEFFSQLVIDRCQLFAVSTPGSIELNQYVLLLVEYNFIEVRGYQSLKVNRKLRTCFEMP